MKLVIQDFSPADRTTYLTFAEEFVHSSAVLHPVPRTLLESNFEQLLRESAYCRGLLLKCDGKPCGYALLSFSYSTEIAGKILWIEELYLSEPYRGKGLGHLFFDWLFSEYKGVIKRFRLEAAPINDRARALYRKFGFETLEYHQMVYDPSNEEESSSGCVNYRSK